MAVEAQTAWGLGEEETTSAKYRSYKEEDSEAVSSSIYPCN